MQPNRPRTALLSVWEKEGIVEFARALVERGWHLLASGGTAKAIAAAGIPVRDVAEMVGKPILDHRVVTLSREIHAGLLAEDTPEGRAELEAEGIPFIDLLCVDFYPIESAIAAEDATTASVIKLTDIGGPAMLRSAAKGRRYLIADSNDRDPFIQYLDEGEQIPEALKNDQAAKGEFIVANYTLASARFHSEGRYDGLLGERSATCVYGENRWQSPAYLYTYPTSDPLAIANFRQVAGQPLSFINYTDLDRALQTVTHIAAGIDKNFAGGFFQDLAIGVKHGNACGAGAATLEWSEAIDKMLRGDPRALFGGVVMTNIAITKKVAGNLLMDGEKRRLFDCIIAPSFTEGAMEILDWRKESKCRLVVNPALALLGVKSLDHSPRLRPVRGGFLWQPNYTHVPNINLLDRESEALLLPEQKLDIVMAWGIGSTSTSNTSTLVRGMQLIGNGVGQQDRVGSCELAVKRARDAGHETKGAVAYTDSFFPAPDGPEELGKAEINAIFASSGSIKDDATRAMCAQYGIKLVMIPDKEGRGFFNH